MKEESSSNQIICWLFSGVVFSIGALNLFLVHPVPGIVFLLLSTLYWPPVDTMLRNKFGIRIPLMVKITLGVVILWFTLGISDLGDMIDG